MGGAIECFSGTNINFYKVNKKLVKTKLQCYFETKIRIRNHFVVFLKVYMAPIYASCSAYLEPECGVAVKA